MSKSIKNYLDQLVWEYAQLCQRRDGSIYGIRSGLKCRKGTPVSQNPNIKAKQISINDVKAKVVLAKAKSIGLSNKEIKSVKSEVEEELNEKGLGSKSAIKLFAKKAKVIQERNKNFERDSNSGFIKPKPRKGYDIGKDIADPDKKLLGKPGGMGTAYVTKGPPPGVLKEGKIGEHEAEALGILKGKGIAPEFYGVKYSSEKPEKVKMGLGSHVREVSGSLAMSRIEGKVVKSFEKASDKEKEKIQTEYIKARKTLHQNGIAHNDLHTGNLIVKPDGSVGLVDFGLAQIGYKFALIEAMGTSGRDWQFTNAHQSSGIFSPNTTAYKTLRGNRSKAVNYLEVTHGIYWDNNWDIPKVIRSNPSDIEKRNR